MSKQTALYKLHKELGAKLVPFAGYSMPLLYPGIQSHIDSHRWVRSNAGLFDVSHMLQSKLSGSNSLSLLDRVTPTDYKTLAPGKSSLSVLLNKDGGIVDDFMVFKENQQGDYYIVSNAARSEAVTSFLHSELGSNMEWSPIHGRSLLALQGPKAHEAFKCLLREPGKLSSLYFGERATYTLINGVEVTVMRGGYTGEDGFEIGINDADATSFAESLLADPSVKPIGLAARDSLRLEAGLCLYGNELNEKTTPVEANLRWLISKSRRTGEDSSRPNFNGFQKIMDQLNNKTYTKQRVGFRYVNTMPAPAARTGYPILEADSKKEIGTVTSGSISPSLSTPTSTVNIGQAYVEKGFHKVGTKLFVQVRKNLIPIEIAKLPLVPTKYYRKN